MKPSIVAFGLLATLFCGCTSVGPKRVERDRVDYGMAMGRSLQEEALLNIVKSRYSDWPSFLDVNQIVAGYSRESTASLAWDWFPDDDSSTELDLGVSGTFTESPTITFTPLVGSDFASTLLQPLDTEAILAVSYAGWRADRLFELTLSSINGKRNAQFVGDDLQPGDAAFWRALDLFRELQRANAWGVRRTPAGSSTKKQETKSDAAQGDGKKKETSEAAEKLELVFREVTSAATRQKVAELKKVLGLDPTRQSYQVVYGDHAGGRDEITFEPRTLWGLLWELQRFVVVPAEDLSAGHAVRLPPDTSGREPALQIRSGPERPRGAFVAVPYGGHWFWIDPADHSSKHTLSVVLLMSTLARSGEAEAPRLVIPTR